MSKPGEKRAKKTQKTLFETFKKPRISIRENSVVDDAENENSVRDTFVESTDHSLMATYSVSYWFHTEGVSNVCFKIFIYTFMYL